MVSPRPGSNHAYQESLIAGEAELTLCLRTETGAENVRPSSVDF